MQETKQVTARLSDGTTKQVEAEWCDKAEWYKARVDGQSVYFEADGTQT